MHFGLSQRQISILSLPVLNWETFRNVLTAPIYKMGRMTPGYELTMKFRAQNGAGFMVTGAHAWSSSVPSTSCSQAPVFRFGDIGTGHGVREEANQDRALPTHHLQIGMETRCPDTLHF